MSAKNWKILTVNLLLCKKKTFSMACLFQALSKNYQKFNDLTWNRVLLRQLIFDTKSLDDLDSISGSLLDRGPEKICKRILSSGKNVKQEIPYNYNEVDVGDPSGFSLIPDGYEMTIEVTSHQRFWRQMSNLMQYKRTVWRNTCIRAPVAYVLTKIEKLFWIILYTHFKTKN